MENQEVRFGFKETTKKVDGKVVKDEKGEPVKIPASPPVLVDIPLLSLDAGPVDEKGEITYLPSSKDLQEILESGDPKQIQLVIDAVNDVKLKHVKLQLDEAIQEGTDVWPKFEKQKNKEGKEVEVQVEEADTSWLDLSKIELSYIASLPPSARCAQGIPEEAWEAFAEDYKEVIQKHGKTAEQAAAAAKHFLNKFAIIRLNKPLLSNMEKNLHLWYANTSMKEDVQMAKIYENLAKKLNILLTADEDVVLSSV